MLKKLFCTYTAANWQKKKTKLSTTFIAANLFSGDF
jgi:hypothetical protein